MRHIRRTRRFPIAKERRHDDEVFLRAERLVYANKPFVVRDEARIPGWVDDGGQRRVAVGFVREKGLWENLARDEGQVADGVCFDFWVVGHGWSFRCILACKVSRSLDVDYHNSGVVVYPVVVIMHVSPIVSLRWRWPLISAPSEGGAGLQ